MSFPIEFGVGNFKASAHLVFELLAFFIGFRYFMYLRNQQNDPISESNRIWILIGATFGAFLFSRLVGAFENPPAFFSSIHPLLYFYANKTILGGLLGGLLCVEITKYFLKEKTSSGDLFTYPLIIAMMIGRVGCFSAGISESTYGIETTLPWGMNLGDNLSRHPVALYEIIFLAIKYFVLKGIEKKHELQNGIRFKIFMTSYLLFRYMLDFIKPGFRFSFGLTTIQLVSLMGLLYYSKSIFAIAFQFKKQLK